MHKLHVNLAHIPANTFFVRAPHHSIQNIDTRPKYTLSYTQAVDKQKSQDICTIQQRNGNRPSIVFVKTSHHGPNTFYPHVVVERVAQRHRRRHSIQRPRRLHPVSALRGFYIGYNNEDRAAEDPRYLTLNSTHSKL